jgi:ABC-type sugar transport system ATPase subunit
VDRVTKVKLEHLTRIFDRTIAVDDLNLVIGDRHFVSLLGPSGCGKTTTLRMIAGLLPPTKGRIFFDDRDVTDLSPSMRGTGLVFQDYAIFPHMNGFDNIAWGLKIRKVSKEEVKARVREVAELLGIQDILKTMPSKMNQSELQRVALARTLVTNPSILLLDEPLSNLDANLRARMRTELKRLQKEINQTVIYVTHDQVEAMAMSDEIAVMNLGRLQQYGSPDEIYGKPANRFVAGFIGSPSMNFINCSFVEEDGKAYLDASAFKLDVTPLADTIKSNAKSSELILGIRPEHIKILEKPSGASNVIGVKVYAIEPIGSEMIVDAEIDEVLIRIVCPETFAAQPGEPKFITFELDQIHIFDKTENAII